MPLTILPPDPEPTNAELAPYMASYVVNTSTLYPDLTRRLARLCWRSDQQKANPDLFAVPFSPDEGYPEYLASPLWASIRKRIRAANPICVGCNRYASEVHHRDYRPRVMRGEDVTPLVSICPPCHRKVHTGGWNASWQEEEARLQALVAGKEGRR